MTFILDTANVQHIREVAQKYAVLLQCCTGHPHPQSGEMFTSSELKFRGFHLFNFLMKLPAVTKMQQASLMVHTKFESDRSRMVVSLLFHLVEKEIFAHVHFHRTRKDGRTKNSKCVSTNICLSLSETFRYEAEVIVCLCIYSQNDSSFDKIYKVTLLRNRCF